MKKDQSWLRGCKTGQKRPSWTRKIALVMSLAAGFHLYRLACRRQTRYLRDSSMTSPLSCLSLPPPPASRLPHALPPTHPRLIMKHYGTSSAQLKHSHVTVLPFSTSLSAQLHSTSQ